MPEKTETRYVTLNGEVPNGGVPPGRRMFSVSFNPGPSSGGPGHPPPYHSAYSDANNVGHAPYYPTLHPGPPVPGPLARQPSAPAAAPAAPPSNRSAYEPPGQYLNGHMLHGEGWSYLTPGEHTTIHFVGDGHRPCDAPNGYFPYRFKFSTHKVPTLMTVGELFRALGMPAGDHFGITEMEELGGDRWSAGVTVTQGSRDAEMTLRQMGWTQRRSEAAAIWVVVKR